MVKKVQINIITSSENIIGLHKIVYIYRYIRERKTFLK